MKFVLLFALCCVAAARADFFDDLGSSTGSARCLLIKTRKALGGDGFFEDMKIKLLSLKCDMGLENMSDDAFLIISYLIIAILALIILSIIISIIRCLLCQ